MKLSVVIPAHNEEGCIEATIRDLHAQLRAADIEHEILVINDNSNDSTEVILMAAQGQVSTLRYINNAAPNGFGLAIRRGLENFTGDAVAIYMADASDSPSDLIRFFRALEEQNVDCVFGSRFSTGGDTERYPIFKPILNRFANKLIQVLFGLNYNDTTNAFKLYRRNVILGVSPLLSHHFNLTVEIPLKAMIRGYSYAVLPNTWVQRKSGASKLLIKEMGSRYLFIMLYCLIEKWLSRGDYLNSGAAKAVRNQANPRKEAA